MDSYPYDKWHPIRKAGNKFVLTWADVISNSDFTLESIWFSPSSLTRVIMDDKITRNLLFMGHGTVSEKILMHPAVPGLMSQVK